jgi:copper homeostasis protein
MKTHLLEIACFSAEAAEIAAAAGAHRIELCENYHVGGLTPSMETIARVRRHTALPLHVIIRPREGGFVFTAKEVKEMKQSIHICREHGVDGVVIGALTTAESIDTEVCGRLIEASGHMSVTFHRAIDACRDMEMGLKELITLGVSRVLTSGGAASALDGAERIARLNQLFGTKIDIIAGGGVRSSNISEIRRRTGCTEYHSAAILKGTMMPVVEEIKKMRACLESVE